MNKDQKPGGSYFERDNTISIVTVVTSCYVADAVSQMAGRGYSGIAQTAWAG